MKKIIQNASETRILVKNKLLELYPNTIEKLDLLIKEAIENAQVTCEITTTNENELTLIKILLDEANYYYTKWENSLTNCVGIYLYKGENEVRR